MPSFIKLPSGSIRVMGTIHGKRLSKTFKTKKECRDWWLEQEEKANEWIGEYTKGKTLAEAIFRYRIEVTKNKKGVRAETNRLNALIKMYPDLCEKPLDEITLQDVHAWRSSRLLTGIKSSTIHKEFSLINSIYAYCITEWFWARNNPFKGLKLPQRVPPRDRILTADEVSKMCTALDYSPSAIPKLTKTRVAIAMLFSLETGMRSGEICNIAWNDIKDNIVHVPDAKTRAGIRDVPLSSKALSLLEQLKPVTGELDSVFNLSGSSRDAIFRKAREKARLSGFTFHDCRATAITRLAKVLSPYELTKMVGHANFNQIMTYYREDARDIAKKLG